MGTYSQRTIADTSPIWRRTSSPQVVTDSEPPGRRWMLADWQSKRLGGEPVRVVGGVAVPNSPTFNVSLFFDALVQWRQGGVVFEDQFSWPVQGWSRQFVCDEIQVFAIRNQLGGGEIPFTWSLGAAMNEGVLTMSLVTTRVQVNVANVFVPVRPPIGTARLRLVADDYSGYVGYADDNGGLPGSPQNLGTPASYVAASAFNEWSAWNSDFGLVSYTISSVLLGDPVVRWEFEVP